MPFETDSVTRQSSSSWIWISLGVVVCLSVLLGQAPPRVRLLGLFAVGEGLVVGLSCGYWAQRSHAARCLKLSLLVGALGIAAFGGTSALWWRQYAEALQRDYQDVPPSMLAMQLQSQAPKPGESHKPITPDQQRLGASVMADAFKERGPELEARRSLSGYLAFRVFGVLSASAIAGKSPQGYALWITEMLLAGTAAAISFRKAGMDLQPSREVGSALESPADSKSVSE